jgi:hypothetical protein
MKNRCMRAPSVILFAGCALLFSACAHYPSGPSVMALPGSTKSFAEFRSDDLQCRDWALYQSGETPQEAATESAVRSALIGTALGAAVGAIIGSAYHDAGDGALIGAGSGLLAGSLAGASHADWAGASQQQRFDNAYTQCMYASGNQVPLPAGSMQTYPPVPPPPATASRRPPSPPPGMPPPPPPGVGY